MGIGRKSSKLVDCKSSSIGGEAKKALFKGRSTRCHGNNGCLFEAWGLIFIQNVGKKE